MSLPAADLLQELSARGVEVKADSGALRLRPASAAADLLDDVREHKAELLQILAQPLASRVRQILLSGERHTTKSLALRLGRPRDLALYRVLSDLLTDRTIATDGASCEFYRRETEG